MRHQRHLRFSTTIPAALTVAASILVGRCGSTISPVAASPSTAPEHSTADTSSGIATLLHRPHRGDRHRRHPPSRSACSLLSQYEIDAAAGQPIGHGNRIRTLDCELARYLA